VGPFTDSLAAPGTPLSGHVVGVERPACVIALSPYDPTRRDLHVLLAKLDRTTRRLAA